MCCLDDEASDHGSISESEEEVVEEDTPVIHATHLSDYSYSDSDEEAKPSSSRRPVKVSITVLLSQIFWNTKLFYFKCN